MRAITICQPYASLIANPPHAKRIENRTWEVLYRGPIAIHAGKSLSYMETWPANRMPTPMPRGVIMAVADLIACVNLEQWLEHPQRLRGYTDEQTSALLRGEFAEGPFCWVFRNIRPLKTPIDCKGAQGLWVVPDWMAKQLAQAQ